MGTFVLFIALCMILPYCTSAHLEAGSVRKVLPTEQRHFLLPVFQRQRWQIKSLKKMSGLFNL